jgi:Protein of unknown function (DUF2723)
MEDGKSRLENGTSPRRFRFSIFHFPFAIGVAVLAAHLAVLPATLEDLDAVNFALGVRHFDVAQHQPHPPGYPVYIALGKIATRGLSIAGVDHPEVRGLALWSAIGVAALVPLLFVFFRAIDGDDRRALIAAVLAVCSPLMWFNGSRPLSDTVGLALATAGLAALASARHDPPRAAERVWIGAFLCGVAIGIRSQMAILTLPFVAFVLWTTRRRVATAAALTIGVAVWAGPLIVLSGGLSGYLQALGSQAGEDFTGVVMLWTNPSPRVAAFALLDTLVRPWDSAVLAGVVLALAAAGALILVRTTPKTAAIAALTFVPYTVFHLLFQEPLTNRYALPLMPLVAYLAAVTLTQAAARYAAIGAVALAAASLAFAVPATVGFGRVPSPIFSFLSEAGMLRARGAQPQVGMHRRVFTESRRARVYAGDPPGTLLAVPQDFEWLEMTRAWRDGHDGESWFIADPRRTDLALIDRSHARVREYRWPFASKVYLGGTRPNELDWYIFGHPSWFLERGWALTPEIAGISEREGWGPHRQPSTGWVRRQPSDSVMVIGGRHLANGAPPATIVASLDGRAIATFDVQPGYFLQFVDVPAAAFAGDGAYASLTVSARAAGAAPPIGLEQFDLQPRDRIVFGLADGWFEPEHNPTTARSWRWMSERAVVRIHNAGRPVSLRFSAEAPGRYFDEPPLVRVSAGDQVLAETRSEKDFSVAVTIPAAALAAGNGLVTITSDRTFVAGEREGTADRRRLALRIYSLTVE